VVAQVFPPHFQHISTIRFSPSGRQLVVGNESCQYFYIYEFYAQTNQRFYSPQQQLKLSYTLFRGYTSAVVTDIAFIQLGAEEGEQILLINSSNGTSHAFYLN